MKEVHLAILAIILFVILAILLLAFRIEEDKKRKTDYYALFTMGLVWSIIGFPTNYKSLGLMGLFFMGYSLVHKKKWKKHHKTWDKLNKHERIVKGAVMLVTSLLVFGGFLLYYFATN
jgi:formate hydrogenlyase subunit 3/multisubunit Na+/H+ antiporter MnhD subunit